MHPFVVIPPYEREILPLYASVNIDSYLLSFKFLREIILQTQIFALKTKLTDSSTSFQTNSRNANVSSNNGTLYLPLVLQGGGFYF